MDISEVRAKYPEYSDIPDAQLVKGLHDKFYSDMPYDQFASKITGMKSEQHAAPVPEKKQTLLERFKSGQMAKNLAGGLIHGAADIGATILSPIDAAAKYAAGKLGVDDISALVPSDRRAAITQGLQDMGFDTQSGEAQAGRIGAQIAGTAGIGGAIAPALKFSPELAAAVKAGGFAKDVNAAKNIAGGAITGGASAGLVNPSDSTTGTAIGAALPSIAKVAATVIPSVLGMTTGAGKNAIEQAFSAGKVGGAKQAAFTDNMRVDVPMTDVLDKAKAGLSQMRADRGAEYRAGMQSLGQNPQALPFQPIEKAVTDAMGIKSFKGVSTSRSTADIQGKINEVVQEWKSLDPAEYHTAEGFDALKQSIGDLRDSTQFGSPERKVADSVYHAVKNEIVKADPKYAETMKGYEQSSALMSEIEKALSLGNKASADTGMRKLQSLMRNNVSTNYGNRADLAAKLEQQGGRDLMPSIAGQALNTWTPRGLQSASTVPTSLIGYGVGGIPLAAISALAGSPRLAGEAALAAGKVASKIPQRGGALARAVLYNQANK